MHKNKIRWLVLKFLKIFLILSSYSLGLLISELNAFASFTLLLTMIINATWNRLALHIRLETDQNSSESDNSAIWDSI